MKHHMLYASATFTAPVLSRKENTVENGTCRNCKSPIIRSDWDHDWVHYPTMKVKCASSPKAEPIRDEHGEVKPIFTKEQTGDGNANTLL